MTLIEDKIRNIVRRVLNEEMGINDEVYRGANEIFLKIKNDVDKKNENNEYDKTFEGDAYRIRGTFSIKFAKETILVTYNSFIFGDEEKYTIYKQKYPRLLMNAYSTYDGGHPSLFVSYNCINGKYDEGIYDRVQHELNHCFQMIKKHDDLCSSNLRDKVDNGLKKKYKDNNVYMASFILYCARKYEQDACANGLYSWLQNGSSDKDEIVHNSAIVRNRRICLKFLKILQSFIGNNEEEKRIWGELGISLNKILQKGENTCEELKNKANRTIFKYIKDTGHDVKFIK
jgi:hypothetical protein